MTRPDLIDKLAPHLPEPWQHANNGLIYGQCSDDQAEAPFVCDVIEDSAMQALGMLSPTEQANARRIVAAVNACQGISTQALEYRAIADLLHALQRFEAAWRRWAEEIRRYPKLAGNCEMLSIYQAAHDALAKAGVISPPSNERTHP